MADILIWYTYGMLLSNGNVTPLCPLELVLSLSLGLHPQHFHCFIQALAFFTECNSVTFFLTGTYISLMEQIKLSPSGPM